MDEENALAQYMEHFNLTPEQFNRNGVQTTLVQAAVIRDVTSSVVPQRQNIQGRVPFNLMKSETLIWVMGGVDYLEVVTRRERRGRSHGLSIRVARGVYYQLGTFRSRSVEWEETAHQDTGLLGFTTKHLYFSGPKKKFRIRYDRIVDFEPFSDGFGLMRDAQTAKPQSFRTGAAGSPITWPSTWPRYSEADLGRPMLRSNIRLNEFSNWSQISNPSPQLTNAYDGFRKGSAGFRPHENPESSSGISSRHRTKAREEAGLQHPVQRRYTKEAP